MKKDFSTRYLCLDASGRQVLKSFQGRGIPGGRFSPGGDEKISLAGGFPNLHPDSECFLSPTLQLNSDFGAYADKELFSLARAEFMRFQAPRYRTYEIGAECRVCVVSNDTEALDRFVDIYGGLLEIEPLLLNASHPEYPSVTELDIISADDSCFLCYRKRAPVKMQSCSYCGNCGTACPENCISAGLYVDYSRCTFCKECEKACADNALDIYGVEEIELRIPAIIVLGKTDLTLPENSIFVYQENQITEYFKTVYRAEIKEVVCHHKDICQYSSRLASGCVRCVDSCPHGAISTKNTGIVVDHTACRECGNCIAVCPTGAMQNGDFDDAVLVEYFQNLDRGHGEILVVGEEQQLHELWWRKGSGDSRQIFYLEYPNLRSLSYFHLLLFFASGFQKVVLLADTTSHSSSVLSGQIAVANAIVESLFEHCVARILGVSEYLKDFCECTSLPCKPPLKLSAYENRRSALIRVLKHLFGDSGKTLTAGQCGNAFSFLQCDMDKCTQCLACLNECKMHALGADQHNLSLTYKAGLCVGCGVCVTVCPEQALSISKEFVVDQEFLQKKTLTQAEPVKCRECGKIFGTRRSLEKVMQILSARERVDTDHFEYCSTCRVVRLFKTEGA